MVFPLHKLLDGTILFVVWLTDMRTDLGTDGRTFLKPLLKCLQDKPSFFYVYFV